MTGTFNPKSSEWRSCFAVRFIRVYLSHGIFHHASHFFSLTVSFWLTNSTGLFKWQTSEENGVPLYLSMRRVPGVSEALKTQTLRILWRAVQSPNYKRYPKNKDLEYLKDAEFRECWTRKYCDYSSPPPPYHIRIFLQLSFVGSFMNVTWGFIHQNGAQMVEVYSILRFTELIESTSYIWVLRVLAVLAIPTDGILLVLGSTRSTEPRNTWSPPVFYMTEHRKTRVCQYLQYVISKCCE